MNPLQALIIFLTLACSSALAPVVFDYENPRPMHPIPHIYPSWYAATEACLGETGDFDAIDFRIADAITSGSEGSLTHYFGIFRLPHRITMSFAWVLREQAVRHEMAHDITRGREIHFDEERRAICDEG